MDFHKNTLALLCFTMSIVIAQATNITNNTTITQHYVFSLSNSPYYISENITFNSNVTIEKGVEIIFKANHSITFNGNIDCGCDVIHTTPIHSRRLADDSAFVYIHHINTYEYGNTNNGGIKIHNTINNTNTAPVIKFCNTKFKDLSKSIDIISQQSADITIDNCHFDHGFSAIFHSQSSNKRTYITDSNISNFYQIQNAHSAPIIYNNVHFNNYQRFCTYDLKTSLELCHETTIRNSKLSGDGTNTGYCFGASRSSTGKLSFVNNTVSNCIEGIKIQKGQNIDISANIFTNLKSNSISFARQTNSEKTPSSVFIRGNQFTDVKSGVQIYFSDDDVIDTNISVVIKNNQFIDNILYGAVISVESYKYNDDNSQWDIHINNNTILNNAIYPAGDLYCLSCDSEYLIHIEADEWNAVINGNTFKNNTGHQNGYKSSFGSRSDVGHFLSASVKNVKLEHNLFRFDQTDDSFAREILISNNYNGLGTRIENYKLKQVDIRNNIFEGAIITFPVNGNWFPKCDVTNFVVQYNVFDNNNGFVTHYVDHRYYARNGFINFDHEINKSSNIDIQYNNFYHIEKLDYFIDAYGYDGIIKADRNYYDSIQIGSALSCEVNIENKDSIIVPFYTEPLDFTVNDSVVLPEPSDGIYYPQCKYIKPTDVPMETTKNYGNTLEIMIGVVASVTFSLLAF